ncbi:MAG: hypothetical protein HC927_07525 [Deltaproteobacteria bacterium]|nr:hypothetical protein [Deltaproteobacteria bacterium]
MPSPLYVSDEDPVNLDGIHDSTGNLQLVHGSDSLADYDQALHAEHEDLANPTGLLRIKLNDFSVGGNTWQITAVHDPGSGSVSWARASDHCYYDFGPLTAEQTVDVTAVSNASPPQTRNRAIRIKTSPTDPQPDRPRG